jgi:hypothetical protein
MDKTIANPKMPFDAYREFRSRSGGKARYREKLRKTNIFRTSHILAGN